MSKYNLTELAEGMGYKEYEDAKEADRLEAHPESDKIKAIQAMMAKEKDAIEKDARKAKGMMEDFDSVVDDIMDQGKSREDAEKIAGSINAKHVGNYREGVEESDATDYTEEIAEENDEDKLPMDEGHSEGDEMKMHLKQYRDGNIDGDDLANAFEEILMGEVSPPSERGFNTKYGMEENHAMQGVEAELESGEIGNMDDLSEEDRDGYAPEVKERLDMVERGLKKSDRNFQASEIKMYTDSLFRDFERGEFEAFDDYTIEDHEEDLSNMIDDKALQEHFGRFMKDYQ